MRKFKGGEALISRGECLLCSSIFSLKWHYLYTYSRPNCNIKIQKTYRKLLFYYFYQGNERQTHATLQCLYVYTISQCHISWKEPYRLYTSRISYRVPKFLFFLRGMRGWGGGGGTYYKFWALGGQSCPILSNRFHPTKQHSICCRSENCISLERSGQSAVDSIDSFDLSNGKVHYRFDKCGRRSDNCISLVTTATRCKIVESIDSFDRWE